MKQIKLSQGKFALVDDADFDWLNQWKWSADKYVNTFYASRIDKSSGVKKKIYMHRLILGVTDKVVHCDHANRNGLDNQRSNLRSCNKTENARNMAVRMDSKSGVKGVHFDTRKQKYVAHITINYKFKFLGYFDNIESASIARRNAEKAYFGEFSPLNTV